MNDKQKLEAIIRSAPALVSDILPKATHSVQPKKDSTQWVKMCVEISTTNHQDLKEYGFFKNLTKKQIFDMALTDFFNKNKTTES